MKKSLFPIIVVLAVACTVGIFYLIFEQHNHLFYISTIATCVAEVLLLMNVPIWSGKKLLTITNATVSIFTNIYAIAICAWTLTFALGIHDAEKENFKIYYIGLLILTLLFIVFCGVSAIGAHTAEEESKEQEALIENRRNVVEFAKILEIDIQTALEKEDSEWKEGFLRLVKMLVEKLSSFPHEKLHNNPSLVQKVEGELTEIATMCEQLASAEDHEAMQGDILSKLNKLSKYVTTIKTML